MYKPTLCLLILATLYTGPRALAQTRPTAPAGDPRTVVLERLRAQPIGSATMRELCPPDEFLGRVADRVIRMDYQKHFRVVAAMAGPDAQGTSRADPDGAADGATSRAELLIAAFVALAIVAMLVIRRVRRPRA